MGDLLLDRKQPHLVDHREREGAFRERDPAQRGDRVVAQALVARARVREADPRDRDRHCPPSRLTAFTISPCSIDEKP